MKTWVRNHKATVAVVTVLAVVVGWWFSAPVRGYFAAHLDLARGHYEVQSTGLPARWRPDYAALLRERYGIQQRTVAGCNVTESLVSYVRAYNGVMEAAANRKFGHDVFAECAADAQKTFKQREAAAARTNGFR